MNIEMLMKEKTQVNKMNKMSKMNNVEKKLKKFYGLFFWDDGDPSYAYITKKEFDSLIEQGNPHVFCVEAEGKDKFGFGDIFDDLRLRYQARRIQRFRDLPSQEFFFEIDIDQEEGEQVKWISESEYLTKLKQGKNVFHDFAPTKQDVEVEKIVGLLKIRGWDLMLEEPKEQKDAERENQRKSMPMQDFYLEVGLDQNGIRTSRFITAEEYRIKRGQGKMVFHEYAPTEEDLDISGIIANLSDEELGFLDCD